MTREDLRADIARVLQTDPAEIGDDDNLFDLGLDSIRLMDLALRWEEAGLTADYGRLMETGTLTDWFAATGL